jgi:hypothetical protein
MGNFFSINQNDVNQNEKLEYFIKKYVEAEKNLSGGNYDKTKKLVSAILNAEKSIKHGGNTYDSVDSLTIDPLTADALKIGRNKYGGAPKLISMSETERIDMPALLALIQEIKNNHANTINNGSETLNTATAATVVVAGGKSGDNLTAAPVVVAGGKSCNNLDNNIIKKISCECENLRDNIAQLTPEFSRKVFELIDKLSQKVDNIITKEPQYGKGCGCSGKPKTNDVVNQYSATSPCSLKNANVCPVCKNQIEVQKGGSKDKKKDEKKDDKKVTKNKLKNKKIKDDSDDDNDDNDDIKDDTDEDEDEDENEDESENMEGGNSTTESMKILRGPNFYSSNSSDSHSEYWKKMRHRNK